MEIAIGAAAAYLYCMLMLSRLLITISEITLECFSFASYGYASVDDISIVCQQISCEEVGTYEGHIAVDKEQPFILSCPD
jgi:hypothetical protein